MKIGVFLGYGPGVRFVKEGLGRYLANLIKGFQDQGSSVCIACPQWLMPGLHELFREFKIDEKSIDYQITYKTPALWSLYERFVINRKAKTPRPPILQKSFADFVEFILDKAVSVGSIGLLFLLGLLAVVLSILLLPVAVVAAIGYILFKLLWALLKKGKFSLQVLFSKVQNIFMSFSKSGQSFITYSSVKAQKNALRSLVNKINTKSNADIWYCPGIFWPIYNEIKGVKVINAPDLVTSHYAGIWAGDNYMGKVSPVSASTIERGRYFITYCEYIRKALLLEEFRKLPKHVVAIPHINPAVHQYVSTEKSPLCLANRSSLDMALAREMLDNLPNYSLTMKHYFDTFDFESVRYIIYPTQFRFHKNIMTLLKAYHHLLRKMHFKVKLFLTGNLRDIPELETYIRENRLEYDICCFFNVSAQHLAAMYKCADLVVNSTLYEGGFLFTFNEGMSVGTPSVMGNIPLTMDVVDGYGLEDALFDPLDYKDIAKKIAYGLTNREELFQKENILYDKLSQRTGAVVAQEYVKAFSHFIELDRLEMENKQ